MSPSMVRFASPPSGSNATLAGWADGGPRA